MIKLMTLVLSLILVLGGCAQKSTSSYPGATESQRINAFFEHVFKSMVARSPETQTAMGIKGASDQLDDRSEAFRKEGFEISKKYLKELKSFDYDALGADEKLSYDLFLRSAEQEIEAWEFRNYRYNVNPVSYTHLTLPTICSV